MILTLQQLEPLFLLLIEQPILIFNYLDSPLLLLYERIHLFLLPELVLVKYFELL
jgi:hypothetical protein